MAFYSRSGVSERRLARSIQRRLPQVNSDTATPSGTFASSLGFQSLVPSTAPAPQSSSGVAGSVKVLAVIVALLSIALLAIVGGWQYRSWRMKKKTAPSTLVKSPKTEKRQLFPKSSLKLKEKLKEYETNTKAQATNHVIVLSPVPPSPDYDSGWVPRLTPWAPPAPPAEDKPVYNPERRNFSYTLHIEDHGRLTPPPTYFVANGGITSPSPSTASMSTPNLPLKGGYPSLPPPAVQKPVSRAESPSPLRLKVTPPSPQSVPEPAVDSPQRDSMYSLYSTTPEPAPRSDQRLTLSSDHASFISFQRSTSPATNGHSYFDSESQTPSHGHAHTYSQSASSSSRSGYSHTHSQSNSSNRSVRSKKLPRLVNVIIDFTPSLPDELLIKAGETVRLLAEFEDEWCVVQRVGKYEAEKGVVPQFCVQDRPEMIPTPRGSSFFAASRTSFGHSAIGDYTKSNDSLA